MRKRVLLLIICFTLCFSACSNIDKTSSPISWIKEKSQFNNYEIQGEKIYFNYSIYLINNSNEDEVIALDVTFNDNEIDDWVASDNDNSNYFLSDYSVVKAKSKGCVDFTFKGKYLGGKINTDLSFPDIDLIEEGDTDDFE
ncbi:MAG: hypothetical protein VZR54_05070 [Ruminococcus sp.]|nr:hypothetical protein [Ruminococcus sp.]